MSEKTHFFVQDVYFMCYLFNEVTFEESKGRRKGEMKKETEER